MGEISFEAIKNDKKVFGEQVLNKLFVDLRRAEKRADKEGWIDEETLNATSTTLYIAAFDKPNQFENCLFSKDFFWGAGDYMIRTSVLDKVNPDREIYVEKNGDNE